MRSGVVILQHGTWTHSLYSCHYKTLHSLVCYWIPIRAPNTRGRPILSLRWLSPQVIRELSNQMHADIGRHGWLLWTWWNRWMGFPAAWVCIESKVDPSQYLASSQRDTAHHRHSPDGSTVNSQIDFIFLLRCFKSRINQGKTRPHPGVDINSDHNLILLTLRLKLLVKCSMTHPHIHFNLEKLLDPKIRRP